MNHPSRGARPSGVPANRGWSRRSLLRSGGGLGLAAVAGCSSSLLNPIRAYEGGEAASVEVRRLWASVPGKLASFPAVIDDLLVLQPRTPGTTPGPTIPSLADLAVFDLLTGELRYGPEKFPSTVETPWGPGRLSTLNDVTPSPAGGLLLCHYTTDCVPGDCQPLGAQGLVALRLSDGGIQWQADLVPPSQAAAKQPGTLSNFEMSQGVVAPVIGLAGTRFDSARNTQLQVLDATSGARLWAADLTQSGSSTGLVPGIGLDRMVMMDSDGMDVLDLRTGRSIWRSDMAGWPVGLGRFVAAARSTWLTTSHAVFAIGDGERRKVDHEVVLPVEPDSNLIWTWESIKGERRLVSEVFGSGEPRYGAVMQPYTTFGTTSFCGGELIWYDQLGEGWFARDRTGAVRSNPIPTRTRVSPLTSELLFVEVDSGFEVWQIDR